jgi:integrase
VPGEEAVTLGEAVSLYLEHRRTQVTTNTLLTDRSALDRLVRVLGPVAVDAVTAMEIDRYVEDMATTSASSRNLRVRKVKQFFAWCQRRGWVRENPVERRPEREDPFEPMYIPRDRFADLLDCTDNPRDRMIIALGLYLFLRSGEIQTLRVGDYDSDAKMRVMVHKTGKVDHMPVSRELGDELHDYLGWYWKQTTYEPENFLVPSLRRVSSAPSSYPGYGRFTRVPTRLEVEPRMPVTKPHLVVQKALAELGLPVFRQGGHTLRRSGARALFDTLRDREGVDGALQTVKSMLHHENVAMTERYLGVTPEREIRDARLQGQEMFPPDVPADVVQLSTWSRESLRQKRG